MPSDARQKILDKVSRIMTQGTLLPTPCDTCSRLGKVCKMLSSESKKCGPCVKQNSPGCSQMGWVPLPVAVAVAQPAASSHSVAASAPLSAQQPATQGPVTAAQLALQQPVAAVAPAAAQPKKKLPLLFNKTSQKVNHLSDAQGYRLPLQPREDLYKSFEVEPNNLNIIKRVSGMRETFRNVIELKGGLYALFPIMIDDQIMDAAIIFPGNGNRAFGVEELQIEEGSGYRVAELKADKYAYVTVRLGDVSRSAAIVLPLDENPCYEVEEETFKRLIPDKASYAYTPKEREPLSKEQRQAVKERRSEEERGEKKYVHTLAPESGEVVYGPGGLRIN